MKTILGRNLVELEKIYIYRVSAVCRLIENTFSIFMQRFTLFRLEIIILPEKFVTIVECALSLRITLLLYVVPKTPKQSLQLLFSNALFLDVGRISSFGEYR